MAICHGTAQSRYLICISQEGSAEEFLHDNCGLDKYAVDSLLATATAWRTTPGGRCLIDRRRRSRVQRNLPVLYQHLVDNCNVPGLPFLLLHLIAFEVFMGCQRRKMCCRMVVFGVFIDSMLNTLAPRLSSMETAQTSIGLQLATYSKSRDAHTTCVLYHETIISLTSLSLGSIVAAGKEVGRLFHSAPALLLLKPTAHDRWENRCIELAAFRHKHGHCYVPMVRMRSGCYCNSV